MAIKRSASIDEKVDYVLSKYDDVLERARRRAARQGRTDEYEPNVDLRNKTRVEIARLIQDNERKARESRSRTNEEDLLNKIANTGVYQVTHKQARRIMEEMKSYRSDMINTSTYTYKDYLMYGWDIIDNITEGYERKDRNDYIGYLFGSY